jgi:MerR family transcriptional regulator, light-induced transcriptional regulator
VAPACRQDECNLRAEKLDTRLTQAVAADTIRAVMDTRDPALPQYPIRVVVRRTGLNASVLRAWERRYGAVVPGRSEGGQRLYSEEDIRKLTLLREVVEAGHSIGQVAGLSLADLRTLARQEAGWEAGLSLGGGGDELEAPGRDRGLRGFLEGAVGAVDAMDVAALDRILDRAALALTPVEVVDDLMIPLLNRIGLLWERGEVSAASEHVASASVRRFLDSLLRTLVPHQEGPVLMVGTPAGHRHEFGALLAGVVAATEGYRVVLLGPDLPATEIAEAARRKGAELVALSAIHPVGEPGLAQELEALREALPSDVDIVVGGPAAAVHAAALRELGIRYLPDMEALRKHLAPASLEEPV